MTRVPVISPSDATMRALRIRGPRSRTCKTICIGTTETPSAARMPPPGRTTVSGAN